MSHFFFPKSEQDTLGENVIQRLFAPTRSLFWDMLIRFAIAIGMIILASVLLWFYRDGLRDVHNSDINIFDVIYFTVVTITTTGYGDIVPISHEARAFITFMMTPIRIAIWFIFVSAAYQLILRTRWETWKIKQMEKSMNNHIVICGFGVSGQAAAQELLGRGYSPKEIVVIDTIQESLNTAVNMGICGIYGDASKERNLKDAAIHKAKNVIVTVRNDESCALICLTVRDLCPHVNLISACKDQENKRLLYQSGANAVIAPSVAGGRLLAAAINSPASATFFDEFIRHGHGIDINDRKITKQEAGKTVSELQGLEQCVVLALKQGPERLPFNKLADVKLREGDTIVVINSKNC